MYSSYSIVLICPNNPLYSRLPFPGTRHWDSKMEKPEFKVVIVSGSVSGLTLANMLEKLNIDYVVLEGYKEIAP